jgi:myo-inositol 2-dehydrogenase / D-chiro-inositol 1-dehydrogenase
MSSEEKTVNRRGFMQAAAASGLLITSPRIAFGADANEKLRLGIIGCGSRGPWIGNLFQRNSNSKVVAVHDYFKDRVDYAGGELDVPEDRRYTGLDGYKELIASDVDAVAIISPPYFHPEQTVAALEAGKHVYIAKPVAVDVPGCNAITAAAKKHEDRLCCLVDFQTRRDPHYQAVVQGVHDGLIGAPVWGQSYYVANRLNIKMTPGSEVARLRNWVFDIALSGDIIVEQNVHVIDVANWMLQAHPVEAWGTGGRKVRTDVGDCWDHYVVAFKYPNDVLIDFSSAQFLTGYNDLCTRIYGSEGTADTHYGGEVWLKNRQEGVSGGKTDQIYRDGAVANIVDFHQAITNGKPINNTDESARSTLTSILGRMAARHGGVLTWDDMMAKNERVDAKLDLPEDGHLSTV